MPEQIYDLESLLELMRRLRTPETGCPWDLEQSYLSITPSTIEEVYEVVDAIEREDFDHLREELGDLLFQIVFYARLAQEEGRFDFSDIVHSLTAKLIRRHPHVFPQGRLDSERRLNLDEEQVLQRWEQIKTEERQEKGQHGILEDVPKALPGLQRAQKLQKRVAKAGMDWRSVEDSIVNLESEIAELREAIKAGDQIEVEDELGDMFFSCVNIARHLKLDADKSLRRSNKKFEQRIMKMEELFRQRGLSWGELDDNQLDQLWRESKSKLAST